MVGSASGVPKAPSAIPRASAISRITKLPSHAFVPFGARPDRIAYLRMLRDDDVLTGPGYRELRALEAQQEEETR